MDLALTGAGPESMPLAEAEGNSNTGPKDFMEKDRSSYVHVRFKNSYI